MSACGYVALSKFVVSNGMEEEVKRAFRTRPHLVDGVPGYLRLEVLSPLDRPAEIWLVTFWTDAGSFHGWHRSHLHHESHRDIPRGLKLISSETALREFEYVAS